MHACGTGLHFGFLTLPGALPPVAALHENPYTTEELQKKWTPAALGHSLAHTAEDVVSTRFSQSNARWRRLLRRVEKAEALRQGESELLKQSICQDGR